MRFARVAESSEKTAGAAGEASTGASPSVHQSSGEAKPPAQGGWVVSLQAGLAVRRGKPRGETQVGDLSSKPGAVAIDFQEHIRGQISLLIPMLKTVFPIQMGFRFFPQFGCRGDRPDSCLQLASQDFLSPPPLPKAV